ncbi:ring canal kelch homolog isoform X2 [Hetaerina americana]
MVLAACSPYFFAMFTSFEESKRDRILLKEFDPEALELLVEYIYSSEITVTEDNVQILLPAANHLQLTDVRDACCDFLETQLHPTNCLGIRAFADLHDCHDLFIQSESYLERHFQQVVECEEFLALPASQVLKLVSSDRLVISSEETVFEGVMSWVFHDDSRRQHLAELIEHVRLPLLSYRYLIQRVSRDPLFDADLRCKTYLIEALAYQLLRAKGDKEIPFEIRNTLPRQLSGLPKIMLVIGGQAPKAIRSVECYDFKEERWYRVAEMPARRCRTGVSVLDGQVYAVGGFNGALRVRSVDRYDAAADRWVASQSMIARRSTVGVAELGGCIYAVGGFDGTSGLSSAEMYDSQTKEWTMIPPMPTRRSSVGVGVLDGLLYAVGGYDGASRQCLSSVIRYNPEKQIWTRVADMSTCRSGAGIGILDGILYAVGGHDGPDVRKSVEAYDPKANVWTPVADMAVCRRNAGVVSLNSILYVVGGDNGSTSLGSVECYNPKTNTWTMLPTQMSIGRSYAGVAIIDKPK